MSATVSWRISTMSAIATADQRLRALYRGIRNSYREIAHSISVRYKMNEAKQRLLSSGDLTDFDKQLVKGASTRVDRRDTMYVGDAVHYLSVGLSALRCVESAIAASGKEFRNGSILDFPSGFGRVLRFLRVRFPDADITAAEIERDALEFCSTNFHVTPLESKIPISSLELNATFDLIWCGSLFTHIDESAAIELLRFFHDHLSAGGGLCVFTTHGARVVERMVTSTWDYGLDDEAKRNLMRGYRLSGYGYVDYHGHSGYGTSAVTPDRMSHLAAGVGSWKQVCFLEHGWAQAHDVFGFVKR
jgi:SAM-dependent methyltransferase